jgi:predicted phosphoadenosine phosphosulfate sulfurtransferase
MATKQYLEKDVYSAALERIAYVFDEFEKVYVSFSGGKDSSVLLQLVLKVAKEKDKLPVTVLHIDFEAWYSATVKHLTEMMIQPEVNAYWVCLPMNLRNSVSVFDSQWQCWDPTKKEKWVREMPNYPCVISDEKYFPFWRYGMEFEEFIIHFGKWFSEGKKTACLVAIRSNESLNRFRTIKNMRKETYHGLGFSTKIHENVYNFYPIYDWTTEDIWTAVGKYGLKYNKVYDLMYMQGKTIHECRLCQPYGDDQRKGLELFRVCEPETWAKVVDRVSGANYGNLYANTLLMGTRKKVLPEGHTWETYTAFLLETLPRYEKEWYLMKLKVFFEWWAKHGYPDWVIPDEGERKAEANRDIPSWRRIAEVILKNDKLCKHLSFAGTKGQFMKYKELRERYEQEGNT